MIWMSTAATSAIHLQESIASISGLYASVSCSPDTLACSPDGPGAHRIPRTGPVIYKREKREGKEEKKRREIVPSWVRTRVVGFKVQSDDHYTNGT